MTRDNRWLRELSIFLVLLIATTDAGALVLLVRALVWGGAGEGRTLLMAAGQVWLTNVLMFADFRFPQDEDHDAIHEVAPRSAAR